MERIICSMIMMMILLNSYAHSDSKQSLSYHQKGDDWEGHCSEGHNQSPIDVPVSEVVATSNIFAHGTLRNMKNATLLYYHNELKVVYELGEFLLRSPEEESRWKSLQFHFHAPAEHHIDGYEYEVELHIVFQNVDDPHRLLVTGILLTTDPNAERNEFVNSLRLNFIREGEYKRDIVLEGLYEKFSGAITYNYKGSLTAPPCTESVEWVLIGEPLRLPYDQIRLFLDIWPHNEDFAQGHGSDRKIQSVNGREIRMFRFDEYFM